MTTTQELRLRALEPSDVEFLYEAENDIAVWSQGSIMAPISRHTLQRYIETSFLPITQSGQLRFIAEFIPTVTRIGVADLFEIDLLHGHAQIGLLVYPVRFQGNGYGYEIIKALEGYAKGRLGLRQLYAEIRADNTRSLQLFKKAEYCTIGVKRGWFRGPEGYIDVHCLQRFLR